VPLAVCLGRQKHSLKNRWPHSGYRRTRRIASEYCFDRSNDHKIIARLIQTAAEHGGRIATGSIVSAARNSLRTAGLIQATNTEELPLAVLFGRQQPVTVIARLSFKLPPNTEGATGSVSRPPEVLAKRPLASFKLPPEHGRKNCHWQCVSAASN
jgi:hypothetical protein